MDISTKSNFIVFKSETFRTPSLIEKGLALWIDRIGAGEDWNTSHPQQLRILGLYCAMYIESGEGVFISETAGKKKIYSGDTIFLFPDEPHLYYPCNSWRTKWVVWHGSEAEQFVSLKYFLPENPVIRKSGNCLNFAYSQLKNLMKEEGLAVMLERKNIILSMLLGLYKAQNSTEHDQSMLTIIKTAIDYITIHYNKELTIPNLASKFNLSETHFRRLFKIYVGQSPRKFINSVRVSRAKEYLSQNVSIKETTKMIGYDDVFYFMRIFKKITGTTPGNFKTKSGSHNSIGKNK